MKDSVENVPATRNSNERTNLVSGPRCIKMGTPVMSQLNKPDVAPIPDTKNGVAADGASIVSLCEEVVAQISIINSPDGPLNYAEAKSESEAAIEKARQQQVRIIDRLEWLATVIPERAATSQDEVAAKIRALDALTSVASWDRESLRVLRVSIGRDRDSLTPASQTSALPCQPGRGFLPRGFRS